MDAGRARGHTWFKTANQARHTKKQLLHASFTLRRVPAMNAPNGAGVFVTTRWSMVLNAAGSQSPDSHAALERLCTAYWYPLYAHARRRGHGAEESRDLIQGFFSSLLSRGSLARVGPEKGRFRTFLLTALDYFLTDSHRHDQALRRGGGQVFVELDALDAEQRYALEPASNETPDKAFDRRWVVLLVDGALKRLGAEQTSSGKGETFERLQEFLAREVEAGEYEAVALELAMPVNTVAVTVRRLRLRLRELVLEEVMQTVTSPHEAEAELRQLLG